jgi:hypothetical protein
MDLCRSRVALGIAAAAVVLASDAAAQESVILPSTRVFLMGPVQLYPQFALRDVGSDSNVYLNQAPAARADFTYSMTPRLYAVVPMGNSRFVGTGRGDLVYYRTYTDQRALTTILEGRYEVTSPGLRPFASVGFVGRGDRVGFEIDSRAKHSQRIFTGGADFDLTPITAITAWASRSKTTFDEDEQYLAVSLAEQLNHTSDVFAAGARFRPTPLTTIVLAAEFERDRFPRVPFRDADGLRVAPSVAFDTGAAITGDVKVGLHAFRPLDDSITEYRGLFGDAHLHYVLPNLVRVDLEANHDVAYSYDPLQPYYLQSGGRLVVTQRVVGPFHAIGIGERRQIRNQRIGGTSFDGRREVSTSLGGGVGVQLKSQMQFSLTYERTERTSTEPAGRHYDRTRILGSIRYGV